MPVNDFDDVLNAPGVDLTGFDPANHVVGELQQLEPNRYRDRHFIVPIEGPFFDNANIKVWKVSIDPNNGISKTELFRGTDWYLTHKYAEASYYLGDAAPPKTLYASISFYDLTLMGNLEIEYQKLGGPFTIRGDQLLALLGNYINNPRMCTYDQIAGIYVRFPPTDHPTDSHTIEWGTTEVSERLSAIEQAILNRIGPPVYTVDQVNGLLDDLESRLTGTQDEIKEDVDTLREEFEQAQLDLFDDLNEIKTAVQFDAVHGG
jgi:hypothetical protein